MPRLAHLVLILFCWGMASSPCFALTLEEAVRVALENNHRVKEFSRLSDAREKRVRSRQAAFMPRVDLGYSFTRRKDEVIFQSQSASVASAQLTYNLFNGLSDLMELRSSRALFDAARYQQKSVEADIVLAASTAYLEVLRAKKNLAVAAEAVDLLERQKRDISLYYREKLVAKNEVLKVEVELATALQDHLQAKSTLQVAREALSRVLGVSLGADVEIQDYARQEPPKVDRELLQKWLKERSEIKYLEALQNAGEHDRDAIRGGYLPSVDLTLSYDRFGDSFIPNETSNPFAVESDARAALFLKWNIFDGLEKKYSAAAADLEARAVEERIRDTEAELSLQLERATERYKVALGNLKVSKTAVQQAEENYRITRNQFRERIATTTDLLDARVFLTRAQNQYNTALYDMLQAIAEIERVVERPLPANAGRSKGSSQ